MTILLFKPLLIQFLVKLRAPLFFVIIYQNLLCMAYEMILTEIENKDAILDVKTIKQALEEKNGMPVPITVFVGDGFDF